VAWWEGLGKPAELGRQERCGKATAARAPGENRPASGFHREQCSSGALTEEFPACSPSAAIRLWSLLWITPVC